MLEINESTLTHSKLASETLHIEQVFEDCFWGAASDCTII